MHMNLRYAKAFANIVEMTHIEITADAAFVFQFETLGDEHYAKENVHAQNIQNATIKMEMKEETLMVCI